MVSSSRRGRRREPQPRLDSILAIALDGTVAKANLQARRVIGEDESIEKEQLGAVLSRLMVNHKTAQNRLVLSVPDEGESHELTLVLSEQESLPAIERPLREPVQDLAPASVEAREVDPRGAVNVADFIAHELRNNIAIMLGLAQLLETTFDSMRAGDRTSALKGIESEGEHALVVLDGLLKLVESRRHPDVGNTRVPLHSVLRKGISDHKRRHPTRAFVVAGDAPVFATGNSTWIQLAVANLISNAEKVTPGDQAIEVTLRQEAESALIMVLDHGQALAPALYTGLWDIYSKGVPAGIEVSGSGIGLSLCKELVGAMGGRVWAGPRSHGGSGFAISLRGLPEPAVSVMLPP